jgi:PKD repeat protein
MRDGKSRRDEAGQGSWRAFHLDGLLLVFLVVGWSLIFATATLGLRRNPQQWLSVKLVPQVAADYGVDSRQVSRLAPVRPQVIEAVKQDALVARPPTPTLILALVAATPTPTSTLTPTPTPTPRPSVLTVSAGGPYVGKEGSPISFVAKVIGLVPEAVTYRWDLDGDGAYDDAKGASVTFVYYDEGEYAIGVQAADSMGRVASDVASVQVSNVAPRVDVGKDRSGDEGAEIGFSAQVSDPGHDVLLYYWDFGDGAGVDGTLKPRHTYVDNGEYVVRLRVEDNDGGVTEGLLTVHVGNLPPVVDAGPDRVTDEGARVTFSGAASDPGVLDTLSYAWDLDYDGTNFAPDVLGPVASAVYSDGPAEVVAALRVQDKDGGQAIDTVAVRVNNVAPVIVSVTDDGPVGEGSPVTLEVTASDVGSDTLSYAFDWENNGNFETATQQDKVSHTWYNQGEYPVGIRVDDGDGGQVFTRAIVSAYNMPPIAVAGPEVTNLEGSPVTFDGSGSSDPGVNDRLSYEWNFGDGSPATSTVTVTHVYADNAVYSATLTVTDDSGAVGSDAVAVTILNANPVANAGPDRTVNEGERANFTGTASDPGSLDTLSYAWDFDYDEVNFHEDANGASVEWTYDDGPTEDDYVVALLVQDKDGGQGLDTVSVQVNNVPPQAVDAHGPYRGHRGQPITLSGSAEDVPADIPLTYEWDLNSDGSYDLSGQSVVNTWNTDGVYTVTLRVTDDADSGFDTARVTIGNRPPIVDAGGPYTGREGRSVALDQGIATDPDNDSPLNYTWDLNYDGSFETPGQVVTHTWPDDGVYTVTLRVDDGWGGVATDVATVAVENVRPTAVSAGGPYTTSVGISVTLVGTGTDVLSDTLAYAWNLDDDDTFETPGRVVTYTWMTTGTHTVTLQVDDGDGGVVTDTTTVFVDSLVPIAWLGIPYFLVRSKRGLSARKRKTLNGGSDHLM